MQESDEDRRNLQRQSHPNFHLIGIVARALMRGLRVDPLFRIHHGANPAPIGPMHEPRAGASRAARISLATEGPTVSPKPC